MSGSIGQWASFCGAVLVLGCGSSDDKTGTSPVASAGGAGGGGATPGAGGTTNNGAGGKMGGNVGGAPVLTPGKSSAAQVATKLGKDHFLVGLGNDLDNDHSKDGAYTLGVTLDVHYAYLVGLLGKGGWPDWNQGGTFVNVLTDSAKKAGVIPMFTLYSMAAQGEGNKAALTNDDYMKPYWDGAKLMYERLAAFDGPALVNFEPDWWGFAQQQAGGNPSSLTAKVGSLAPDCAGLPEDITGMGKCLVVLAHKYAPKVAVGFHVSGWAGEPAQIVTFMKAVGADTGDFLTTDTLDRDAGCFEAKTDPNCQRGGNFYWDETNQSSPNFHEHLAWVKTITEGVGKPMLWWQTPLGVPSGTPGGTAGHYRDNRVKYVFEHVDEFVAAGGLGVLFGTGAGNQTDWKTDGGQLKNAVTKYLASPAALP